MRLIWLCGGLILAGSLLIASMPVDDIAARASKLHASAIVIDTHADTPQRLLFEKFDLGHRDARGHLDIPRMREGGLNAVFMSLWTRSKVNGQEAVKAELHLIHAVRVQVGLRPPD